MFKWFRRISLLTTIAVLIGCIVLLLNVTAPNPTGRRYSSEIPLMTGEGMSQEIGEDGEKVLAADLRLPRNDEAGFRQCICQTDANMPGDCNVCFVTIDNLGASSRRPDFIGADFIAESKNRQTLLYSDAKLRNQLQDYTRAALQLDVPLWIYVRIETHVDKQYFALADSTGGGVIKYFQHHGYRDPVDENAKKVGAVSSLGIALLLLLELIIMRLRSVRFRLPSLRPGPRKSKPSMPEMPRIMSNLMDDDPLMRDVRIRTEVKKRKHRLTVEIEEDDE